MPKDTEYYLENGFGENVAEYFAGGRRKAIKVTPNDDYTLTIDFDNGETKIFDVLPLVKEGTVFTVLKDMEVFSRVYIDKENNIAWDVDPAADSDIMWNNKIDLGSDNCYIKSIPVNEERKK